ncbi:MAG TPA: ABC transporter permease [Paludibacter sp.]|nr:ABC transporter permease [Paludibacter sp.]HPM08897.1 ABC transporter permease [Paludibacter sp.]
MSNIYDSLKNPPSYLEELRSILKYKDLIFQLIRRDIVTRYKRSVLGVLWTMLNPLGTMIILSIVFSRMFNMRGVYPAYVITGLVAWTFFAQTTQFSLNSTLWGSELLKRIYMPRTSFIVATAGTNLVNLLFSLVPLTFIFLVTKVTFRISILFLPLSIILLLAFALGISFLLSTLVVYFPDTAEFYPVILTAWMYLTPIIYPESLLMDTFNGGILYFNPFYYELKIFRNLLFDGTVPQLNEWAIAAAISLVTFLIGWLVFTNKSKKFGYYV